MIFFWSVAIRNDLIKSKGINSIVLESIIILKNSGINAIPIVSKKIEKICKIISTIALLLKVDDSNRVYFFIINNLS